MHRKTTDTSDIEERAVNTDIEQPSTSSGHASKNSANSDFDQKDEEIHNLEEYEIKKSGFTSFNNSYVQFDFVLLFPVCFAEFSTRALVSMRNGLWFVRGVLDSISEVLWRILEVHSSKITSFVVLLCAINEVTPLPTPS